jgi:prolipoprotein diacylglyceryltransferase
MAARHLAMRALSLEAWLLRRRAADGLRRAAEARRVKGRALSAALAVLVAAGVAALLLYAGQPDPYYQEGDVSRWEHARDWNGGVVFAGSIVLGIVSFVGLLARAAGKAGRLAPRVLPLTALALLSFPIALVAVSVGH